MAQYDHRKNTMYNNDINFIKEDIKMDLVSENELLNNATNVSFVFYRLFSVCLIVL